MFPGFLEKQWRSQGGENAKPVECSRSVPFDARLIEVNLIDPRTAKRKVFQFIFYPANLDVDP